MSAADVQQIIAAAETVATKQAGDQDELQRLASLSPIDYDRERKTAAKQLDCRASTLDRTVSHHRALIGDAPAGQGTAVTWEDPESWPEPVDGRAILDGVAAVMARYLVLQPGAADALALWVVHTHTHAAADTSPILAITSPEKRCGKTTVLSVVNELVARPLTTANITAAALFRAVELWQPTLLIDEADSFLADNEDLRGVINSGHSRVTAYVIRTVGDDHEPRRFATWSPKAIAAIGKLPGTITDRSIAIVMRRRLPTERTTRWRARRDPDAPSLLRMIARWSKDYSAVLTGADPEVPEALHDRAADNWRPLLAIADAAGGDWPDRARQAALILSGADAAEDQSRGVMVLNDIRAILDERADERISSSNLAAVLGAMEHRPWADWKGGKPIAAAGLARLLKPYGIEPRVIRIDDATTRGYDRAWFVDVWARYLDPRHSDCSPHTPHQSVTSVTSLHINRLPAKQSVTSPDRVTLSKAKRSNNINDVTDVTVATPPSPGGSVNFASPSSDPAEKSRVARIRL